jgi:hypothetical protein
LLFRVVFNVIGLFYMQAYKKIGDDDAVYGFVASRILDPQTNIFHYELTGKWHDVLYSYDLELSNGNEDATGGMFILHSVTMLHLVSLSFLKVVG